MRDFARILIELSDDKRYEKQSRGKDDMDIDLMEKQRRESEREEPWGEDDEYSEVEWQQYNEWLEA